jgi:drug/metabolite transporter (DMT)-like permease
VLYLLLKVASSVGMGLVLKRSETAGLPRLPVIRTNYFAAAVLAFAGVLLTGQSHISRPTAILAAGTGVLFVAGILLWSKAISVAGLGLSVVAMRAAIAVPVLASVLVWRERPGPVQWLGTGLALCALVLVVWEQARAGTGQGVRGSKGWLWLVLLFLADALVMLAAKAFREQLPQTENLPFQTVTFISAFFVATILGYVTGRRSDPGSFTYGSLLGAANLGNYLFLILSLSVLPGVVVYPAVAAAEVALAALLGILLWKERFGWRAWLGLSLALAALALIPLGRASATGSF